EVDAAVEPQNRLIWYRRWDWSLPRFVPLYAAIHLTIQGTLSTLVYRGCLRFAEWRGDAGQLYAQWELAIPFIPAMVVPYLSVYLLFVGTFFVCRSARELMTLSLRLLSGLLVSAASFCLLPLQSGFVRPQVAGFYGELFRVIDANDAPFNMAPSLHVTTTVILAATLAAHSRRWLRGLLMGWCGLIVASTAFTWQHHLIDIATGLLLGAGCVRLIRPTAAPASACGVESSTDVLRGRLRSPVVGASCPAAEAQ
ncbi:MAG: phosphatase PAP2 family protein, partial [Phycisphaerales bacterium]|nr:phosphatase PAP2 family protein [Phycisphaerales bacterium]